MSNLFSFPDYFYSSLRCPKEKFIKAWNNIPDKNKQNINIRAAVGMTCIKLSDDVFYKDFSLSENYFPESKKIDIALNVDDIFSYTVYEGYEKIIHEQDDELKKISTSDELIDILKEKIVIFGEPVSLEKFTTNSLLIVMSFANPKAVEGKYKVIRDLLAKYGWYMSIKKDYIKNGEPTGFKQLVFEPTQIPNIYSYDKKPNSIEIKLSEKSLVNRVMKFVKKVFSVS